MSNLAVTVIPEVLQTILQDLGVQDFTQDVLIPLRNVAMLAIVAIAAHMVAKRYLLAGVGRLVRKTKSDWDDVLLHHRLFERLAQLVPAAFLHIMAGMLFQDSRLSGMLRKCAVVWMYLVGSLVIDALLNSLSEIYQRFEVHKTRPIKGYIQATKLVIYCLAAIFIFSTIVEGSPWKFFSALGAVTAVILFIFREPILGMVAGIQLTFNNMIRVGDWISIPQYNADGDVIDISLTTVKIQNWDKTISNVPIVALISGGFTNWRGMMDAGGRRIKRAIFLDMGTIAFCKRDFLAKLDQIKLLKAYMADYRRHLDEAGVDLEEREEPLPFRYRLTNLAAFTAYTTAYLKQHPKIHKDAMTLMVRQLAPNEHGLPLELYCFCNDISWTVYESIQSEIFDHLLAVLPEFGLRAFQFPSSNDVGRSGFLATNA